MADQKPFHNPFGALGALRDRLPQAPPADTGPIEPGLPVPSAAPAKPATGCARAVVRMERAGRGGKEATVIEQLDLAMSEREAWLRSLKSALGCGGTLEGDALVLQGDHRKRLKGILTTRGVRKVILG
jgi:translation initiation factor 1